MYRTLLFAAFLSFPAITQARQCSVPEFEKFELSNVASNPDNLSLQITMQPVAHLRIPAGFSRIGAFPDGSMVLGQHPAGVVASLGFETKASISFHKKGVTPARFLLSIFKGLDSVGCRYLEGYQLESEDYRLHANLGKGAELFAYGKDKHHHFYLIRPDKPDFVLNGLFKNMDRAEFESILSTLTID